MSAKKGKKEFAMNDDYMEAEALSAILDDFGGVSPIGAGEGGLALSAQVDEVVQGLSGAKSAAQVYLIDIKVLEPYPDQPFKEYSGDRLRDLADDIGRVGILSPILVRRHKNKLQVLAGHNRLAAAKLAGLTEVPALIMDADDDQAVLIVTSTNLRQREKLMPSEKAFAYKMQMDALKRQGRRGGDAYSAASFITGQTGDSRMQIHRYIRLAELEPELMEMLDSSRISMTPAVAVSYLPRENQRKIIDIMHHYGVSLTMGRANKLKNILGDRESLSSREIEDIMLSDYASGAGGAPGEVSISYSKIAMYLPDGIGTEEIREYIVAALKEYGKARK